MADRKKKTESNPIADAASTAASAVILVPILIIEGIFGIITS